MATLVEEELAVALSRIAEEFKIRATAERDFRAATYFIAVERLRIRWEAGAYADDSTLEAHEDQR